MNKKKILLVGNGPCVLDDERGQEIDNFEGKIARINGYQIDTYEKYVGTKTDILVIGQIDIKDQLEKKYDYVILYLSKLDGGENMRQLRLLYSHNKIIQFPIICHER